MEGPEVKRNLGPKWVDPFNATELFLYPLKKSFPVFSGSTERDQRHEKNEWLKTPLTLTFLLQSKQSKLQNHAV